MRFPFTNEEWFAVSALSVSRVLAGLAVSDLERSVDWMTQFRGRGPDERPMPPLADWNFDAEHTLQLFHDPDRAGGSMVTLSVRDIEAAKANLAARGVELRIDDSSDKVRFGQVQDVDGNSVTIVQPGPEPSTAPQQVARPWVRLPGGRRTVGRLAW